MFHVTLTLTFFPDLHLFRCAATTANEHRQAIGQMHPFDP
jgi:hypothetical protein